MMRGGFSDAQWTPEGTVAEGDRVVARRPGGEMHDQPAAITRTSLAARYRATRDRTERLCAPLEPEDYQLQSMPDCSPPKWHLAHTAWFFETFVLAPHAPQFRPFHPLYGYLFNSY